MVSDIVKAVAVVDGHLAIDWIVSSNALNDQGLDATLRQLTSLECPENSYNHKTSSTGLLKLGLSGT